MRVKIKGVTPLAGIGELASRGRFFPTSGEGRIVEVLPGEPPMVMVGVRNSTTEQLVPTPRPDPDRMSQDDLDEIEGDGRFQIIQLDQVSARAADAAVSAMRQRVQELTTVNGDQEIAIAQLEAQVEDAKRDLAALTEEHAALKIHAAELEEMIGAGPTKAPESTPASPAADTTPPGGPQK